MAQVVLSAPPVRRSETMKISPGLRFRISYVWSKLAYQGSFLGAPDAYLSMAKRLWIEARDSVSSSYARSGQLGDGTWRHC